MSRILRLSPIILMVVVIIGLAVTMVSPLSYVSNKRGQAHATTTGKPQQTPQQQCAVQLYPANGATLCIRQFTGQASDFPLGNPTTMQQICVARGITATLAQKASNRDATATLSTTLKPGCHQVNQIPVASISSGAGDDGMDVGYLGNRQQYAAPPHGLIHSYPCGDRQDFFKLYSSNGGSTCFADSGLIHLPTIQQAVKICGGRNIGDIIGTTPNGSPVVIHITRWGACVPVQQLLGTGGSSVDVHTIYIKPLHGL